MAIVQSTYTEHLTQTLHKLVFNRQTGLMSIEHIGKQKRERGEIYFEVGEIVLARTDNERGVTALARIQDWQQAYYTFHEDATIPLQIIRPTHQVSITALPRIRRTGAHTLPPLPCPHGLKVPGHFPRFMLHLFLNRYLHPSTRLKLPLLGEMPFSAHVFQQQHPLR